MVRIKSILEKIGEVKPNINKIYSDTERNIYIKLTELSRILNKVIQIIVLHRKMSLQR